MLAKWKPYAIGILTYTPLAKRYGTPETGGSDDPLYCYGVFMRHLVYSHRNRQPFPRVVAELGPGDSIGAGLAWLIAGADRYLAFDVRRYATVSRNLEVFDGLIELFRDRARIPGADVFPELKPSLEAFDFPGEILPRDRLESSLAPDRLDRLRCSVERQADGGEGPVSYVVPWDDAKNVRLGTVDFIFSQAAMEHVDDPERVYATFRRWLKPEGMISHQIDFRSHGTSPTWDGYRAYSEFGWRIVRGRRPYLINRVPAAGHFEALRRHGFRVVTWAPTIQEPTLEPRQYAKRFRDLAPDSRRTSGLFLQAVLDAGDGGLRGAGG